MRTGEIMDFIIVPLAKKIHSHRNKARSMPHHSDLILEYSSAKQEAFLRWA